MEDITSRQTEHPDYAELLRRLPTVDLQALIERRYHRGRYCPRCGSRHYHGHGQYRGRPRFICVKCGKTFTELTLSPLHGTHYPEKWGPYVCCLYWGLSLRLTARLVGISLPTAFAWRHKLLSALRRRATWPSVEGIVEFDEVYILESEKGRRPLHRPARHRGTGHSMSRGLAKPNRACVLVARDRRDGTLATVLGMGQPTVFDVERALSEVYFLPTNLCADNRQAYWSLSRRLRIPRQMFMHHRQRRGLYHVENVNGFLTRFEKWLSRFNGVATRYLPNYVHWHVELEEARRWRASPLGVSEYWLLRAFEVPTRTTNRQPFAA